MKAIDLDVSISRGSQDQKVGNKESHFGTAPKSIIGLLFQLYVSTTKQVHLPHFVSILISIFFYFQVIYTASWPLSENYKNSKIFATSQAIFWFMERDTTGDSAFFSIIVTVTVFAVCFVYMIIIFAFFNIKRTFLKWTLYPTSFILEIVSVIFLHPLSASVGENIYLIMKDSDGSLVKVALVVAGVVGYFCFFITHAVSYKLLCSSAILNISAYSSFDPSYVLILSFSSSLFVFIQFLFLLFERWVTTIIQVLHLLIFIYLFWSSLLLNHHTMSGSCLFFAVVVDCIMMDILGLIVHYIEIDTIIILAIAVSLFFVSIIVGYFVVNSIKKNMAKKLSLDLQSTDISIQQELTDRFTFLEINKKPQTAISYLHAAMFERCEVFTDFTLVKYIVSSYQDNIKVLASCLQVVSFFPSQTQLLNSILKMIIAKNKIKYYIRFMLYQVYNIKVMRQSSIPHESNSRLLTLKAMEYECNDTVNAFWTTKEKPSVGLFETIDHLNERADHLFEEGIRDYPNNPKYSEEFIRFLTECRTDLKKAIWHKQRIDMIDSGHNFSQDYVFRSFARSYPDYLKKHIVSVNGNIKINNDGTGNESMSESEKHTKSGPNSLSSTLINIDSDTESMHAKSLFTQPKLRMGLNQALMNSKLDSTKLLLLSGIISCLCGTIIFVTMPFLVEKWLFIRSMDSKNTELITYSYFHLSLSSLYAFFQFVFKTGRFNDNNELKNLLKNDKNPIQTIKLAQDILPFMKESLLLSSDHFNEFLNELSVQGSDGIEIYISAASVFENTVKGSLCYNGNSTSIFNWTFKEAFTELVFDFSKIGSFPITPNYYLNDYYCEIPLNMIFLSDSVIELLTSLGEHQHTKIHNFLDQIKDIMISLPIVMIVFCVFPFLLSSMFFHFKIKQFITLLTGIDTKTKDKCKCAILLHSEPRNEASNEHIEGGHRWMVISIVYFFFAIFMVVLIFLIVWSAKVCNDDIGVINDWQLSDAERLVTSVDAVHFLFQGIILNGSVETYAHDPRMFFQALELSLQKLITANIDLLKGSDHAVGIVGYDQQLDDINIKENCGQEDQNRGDTDFHVLYKCSSANHVVNLFIELCIGSSMKMYSNQYKGMIEDSQLIHILHMVNVHMWNRIIMSNNRLLDLIRLTYSKACTNVLIYSIFGILFSLVTLALGIYASTYSNRLYHTGLSLVQHIPPNKFVTNKELLNFVIQRKEEHDSKSNSCISQSVITHSADGIIRVNTEGIIDIINSAVTKTLGYLPDQLLGQSITEIFGANDKEKIHQQLITMFTGKSINTFEDHFKCISDSSNEVPCQIHILTIRKSNQQSNIDSFVFIIKDETDLMIQQTEAENAKAQSEKLLFQILPRDIVTRLNRGERDISFTVPSASIIFTDIVRFSEYASGLAPAEIMGNLSLIFAQFDERLKQYPSITKIKLIGDIYMAAAGLFINEDAATQPNHADQMVRFGLDCLLSIDEMNIKLESSLQLRVGINTGGPLLAGVLGTDKPVFDIIGDPINVAARLQTTDIPGRIQIPQSTFDLINNSNFFIEKRGEVFLKGKGKTIAYFVNPMVAALTSFSDDQIGNSSKNICKY